VPGPCDRRSFWGAWCGFRDYEFEALPNAIARLEDEQRNACAYVDQEVRCIEWWPTFVWQQSIRGHGRCARTGKGVRHALAH
jgi:hypothetical protein